MRPRPHGPSGGFVVRQAVVLNLGAIVQPGSLIGVNDGLPFRVIVSVDFKRHDHPGDNGHHANRQNEQDRHARVLARFSDCSSGPWHRASPSRLNVGS